MSKLQRCWDKQIELAEGDEVQAAIGILRCSQLSHQQWIDYFDAVPEAEPREAGGSREFDQRCVDEYEKIIEVIEKLRADLEWNRKMKETFKKICQSLVRERRKILQTGDRS